MTQRAWLGAALLLLAVPAAAEPAPSAAAAVAVFAPPLNRPMTYRVTTRRPSRDGMLASYTAIYDLQWRRIGRGIELTATLRGVESDARPELAAALTRMLQPLVGQPIAYLVAPDGSSIDMVDPDALWQRVLGQVHAEAATAARPEARQTANLLAALPLAERDRIATADIRALVAAANPAVRGEVPGGTGLHTVTRAEVSAVGAQPLKIGMAWTIDRATGLVVEERRQSWLSSPDGAEPKLVEERIRALQLADPI